MMEFATLQEWFDRDFPGHYMRMIKSITLTFTALVPPNEGIHATFRNNGLSKIMVGPPFTQAKTLLRQPESISVTVPNNGSGLFEIRLEDELLLPFENSGVETFWTLELPKGANRFDFDSLADVSMTVRYTALESQDYRDKVLRQIGVEKVEPVTMRRYIEANRDSKAFCSLRNRFPDAWYHFHNPVFLPAPAAYGYGPGQNLPPYGLGFKLKPSQFPPNETNHTITSIVIAAGGPLPGKIPVEIIFKEEGASVSHTVQMDLDQNGLTLDAANFPVGTLTPFGDWSIRVRNEATGSTYNALFSGATTVHAQKKITTNWLTDLLFVVQYKAVTEYPL
jgi:hypothetical protein